MLALGASIITRIQRSLPLEAASRVEVVTTLPWPCAPLATTVVDRRWRPRIRGIAMPGGRCAGIGALAATMLARSTGEEAAGA